ncbi:MAG: NAD(P)/FAD-dependent oxidoreductase [Armatimonadota bacterium]
MKFKYLIIGNSAAAIGAVEAIRKVDEAPIGIISDEAYPAYSRPRISERIGGTKIDELAYRPADFYEKNGVTCLLGRKATAVDFKKKRVQAGEEIAYGRLLLATGAQAVRPPVPGIERTHSFIAWDDVDGLSGARQVVVVGGGLIGMQAAEALAKVGAEVTVVEMLDRVLPLSLDARASAMVRARFEEHGVRVLTSEKVVEINKTVKLASGEKLPCDAVICAAGVRPRTELAEGLTVNRGIVVDDYMRTGTKDVWAAGDVAEATEFLSGERKLVPVWPNAYMMGRTAGFDMAGQPQVYNGSLSLNAAHFFDFPVLAAGWLEPHEGCTELVHEDPYRRIILRENVPVGMVMAGDAVDGGGLVLSMIRNRMDATDFLDKLADPGFSAAHLPAESRRVKREGSEKI